MTQLFTRVRDALDRAAARFPRRSRREGASPAALVGLCVLVLTTSCYHRGGPEMPRSHLPPIPLTVTASRYGHVEIRTAAGATCLVGVEVEAGEFADGPPPLVSGTADAEGALVLDYPAPRVPAGTAQHYVDCLTRHGEAEAVAPFAIVERPMASRSFRVRVHRVRSDVGLPDLRAPLEASLEPTRDAIVEELDAALEEEWRAATRGLGSLAVVASSADVAIEVVPASGRSRHVWGDDRTDLILLYAADLHGPLSPQQALSVALHELGHSWCCDGPEAGPGRHWGEALPDPQLQGVDRFGLMTHPMTCWIGAGVPVCPTRFSERELRSMGFEAVPAPIAGRCTQEVRSLQARHEALEAALDRAEVEIAAERSERVQVQQRLLAIEEKYGYVLPRAAFEEFLALSQREDILSVDLRLRVKAYDLDLRIRKGIERELASPHC